FAAGPPRAHWPREDRADGLRAAGKRSALGRRADVSRNAEGAGRAGARVGQRESGDAATHLERWLERPQFKRGIGPPWPTEKNAIRPRRADATSEAEAESERMPTLVLSPRYSEDSIVLWRAAIRRGWTVERPTTWRLDPSIPSSEVVLY